MVSNTHYVSLDGPSIVIKDETLSKLRIIGGQSRYGRFLFTSHEVLIKGCRLTGDDHEPALLLQDVYGVHVIENHISQAVIGIQLV